MRPFSGLTVEGVIACESKTADRLLAPSEPHGKHKLAYHRHNLKTWEGNSREKMDASVKNKAEIIRNSEEPQQTLTFSR